MTSKKRAVIRIVVLFLSFAAYGFTCIWDYIDKPPYRNQFGFNGRLPLIPTWSHTVSLLSDSGNNVYLFDFALNHIVILQVDDPSHRSPWVPSVSKGSGTFVMSDGRLNRYPITRNTVVLIRDRQTKRSFPPITGQAGDAYDKFSSVDGMFSLTEFVAHLGVDVKR